jgi:hypothetical protein
LKHYIPVEQPKRKVVRQAEVIEIQSPGHHNDKKNSQTQVLVLLDLQIFLLPKKLLNGCMFLHLLQLRENFWPAPEILEACSSGIGVYGAYPPVDHGPNYELPQLCWKMVHL